MRRRLSASFDHFTDISGINDADSATLIANDEINILVDLSGLTDFGRAGVIARRPAPITAHYLGYPGPLGTRAIDYLIADHTVIPPGRDSDYDSAIVRLPGSYQVNDRNREMPVGKPTRQEVGLPPNSFVFCGFCQPAKLSASVFDIWMRILTRAPDSVLWLLEDNRFVRGNLCREARVRGIDPSRLVFAPRVNQNEHLARHQLANLLLDTWPCSAHTSASDALWLDVPVITKPGRTFASRVAASVLAASGLSDLVVESFQAYEDLAVELANSPTRLMSLKRILSSNKATSSLFATERFRNNIERAYVEMWARFVTGRPVESFNVHEGSNLASNFGAPAPDGA
jgi:predicted O-linked N-acetylglucosamine transferase (SPINDLY family)